MNISFQTITGQKTQNEPILSGMDADGRIVSGPSKTNLSGKEGYAVNLDGSGFSSDVYGKHARSAEDVSRMAQDTDVLTRHNYMALLSNTMSPEDFAKAAEDGFDIKNTDSEETVTIVDKIKSVLLESGVEIVGYNDDLSFEKLSKITGSEGFARSIQNSFRQNDIPLTSDNVKAANQAYEQVEELTGLDDSAVKFMVLNNMRPTIENIYFASHSTNGQNVAERGFYAEGGYYAQKADNIHWDQLVPQMEKVIGEAGMDPKDADNIENAKWMVSQGIPLTPENITSLETIRSVEFPISFELAAGATASAIADGKRAVEGDLSDPASNLTKAARYIEDVKSITDENIKDTLSEGKILNIRNLTSEFHMAGTFVEETDSRFVTARLQLEEVRLQMTVEANKQLLDSGFSIDTAPMEDLIERLKTTLGYMGDEAAGKSVDEITQVTPANTAVIARMTMSRVSIIKEGPADVVGKLSGSFESMSLFKISTVSEEMTTRFRQAGEGYEKLMTAPRADLGDSIKKAFRNVDDILKDLGKELSDENRRTIRILGYNRMEVSEENFEKVRALDVKLQATVDRLKPGAVLDLIREGKNPLSMTIEELSQSLDQGSDSKDRENSKDNEKYSRFLYKLEKKGDITKEEKASFIGIYRLFHTLKTTDYQAIGSLLKTGRDMTVGNLLDATRTQKTSRRGMDYTVDDEFGGLGTATDPANRIDSQINTAFTYYRAKAQVVYENLEPEKLAAVKPNEQTLLPELADELAKAKEDKDLSREYLKQQLQTIRQTAALKAAEPALDEMKAADIQVTYNNLEAMIENRRDRRNGHIWEKAGTRQEQKELIEKMDEDNYEETYVKILEDFSDKLSEEIMTGDDNYIDVRAISLMQKQLSVMGGGAESGSFDLPVEIEGQVISMHVTLNTEAATGSRMDASVQTDEYGLLTASLYIERQVIRGMITTSNGKSPEIAEYLEDVRNRMCEGLEGSIKEASTDRDNIAILYHTQSLPAHAGGMITDATEGNNEKTQTRTLLTMAKAFIEAL
ncbi:DUF6240 domain-containing protein [Butyrivibrio sp. FCS014]|uniref:DUF6240 domain-containing protein n=1 Tax=Butyrivibrio sp. FCS014 TaxID=1408304 RepID=UPI0004635D55|nr:DUF6240 domain-containing protein [Butyrivibrio sp. FCS014]